MKISLIVLAVVWLGGNALGQGTVSIPPIPITNGLTGEPVQDGFLAGLYFGPAGVSEGTMLLDPPTDAVAGGFVTFGDRPFPSGAPPGGATWFQVRVWPTDYATYELAVAAQAAPSGLLGKSTILAATLPTGPSPPVELRFPGIVLQPVPEPATWLLAALGFAATSLWNARRSRLPRVR